MITNVPAIDFYGMSAEIPGLKALYTSADVPYETPPDQVMRAVTACRELNADAVAIESDERIVIAVVNVYDDTHAAAVCDPGVSLSAIARILHVRLPDPTVTDPRPEVLSTAAVRMTIRRWERRIAVIFGVKYAAALVAAAAPAMASDAVTTREMEKIRRTLLSATGGCIDLPS